MKTMTILLLGCFLFVSCSKKEYSIEVKQEAEGRETLIQETAIQEMQKSDISYVFDIDSFKYLDEFPRTIAGIKEMYPDEAFEEKTSENDLKGFLGSYWYGLSSPNVRFSFLGNTVEDANLRIAIITSTDYQCETMQIIGMSAEELENVSGVKLTLDKTIRVSTELYILVIETKDGIVTSYRILEQL